MPSPTPLRELLVCLVGNDQHLFGALVLRQGLSFTLVSTFLDQKAALLPDPSTLEQLSRAFELPVKLLDPDNSSFLGAQILLARRQGRTSYSLKG